MYQDTYLAEKMLAEHGREMERAVRRMELVAEARRDQTGPGFRGRVIGRMLSRRSHSNPVAPAAEPAV